MTALASGQQPVDSTEGKFAWPAATTLNRHQQLSLKQLNALVLGLPWQRLGNDGIITVV